MSNIFYILFWVSFLIGFLVFLYLFVSGMEKEAMNLQNDNYKSIEGDDAVNHKKIECSFCEGDRFIYIPVAWSGDELIERCGNCNGTGWEYEK